VNSPLFERNQRLVLFRVWNPSLLLWVFTVNKKSTLCPLEPLAKPGKWLFMSKVCPLPPRALDRCVKPRIYVRRGSAPLSWRLTCVSALLPRGLPFKGILNWFGGRGEEGGGEDIVKQMINLYPCQVRLCADDLLRESCRNAIYIPTDCYSPLADGKIHYIIKRYRGRK